MTRPPKYDWSQLDLTKTAMQNAASMGCDVSTIRSHCLIHQIRLPHTTEIYCYDTLVKPNSQQSSNLQDFIGDQADVMI